MPAFEKVQKRYKPGYVDIRRYPSVIYLGRLLPDGSGACAEQPTPRQWTSNPLLPVYLALQPIGCAAYRVATASGGLLPRLFTLTARLQWRRVAVVFCHIVPDVAAGLPLTNMVLCVARTFLFMLLA